MGVQLRRVVTNPEVGKRASALVLQVESTARDVCMAMGSNKRMGRGAAGWMLQVLQDYFALDALDAVHQDVICGAFRKDHSVHGQILG